MRSRWLNVLLVIATSFSSLALTGSTIELKDKMSSPHDLRLSGELPGLPPGSVRYISYEELNTLPLVTFRVTNDPNFHGEMNVTGVYLDELLRALNIPDKGTMVAAVCDDDYEAHYTDDYRHAHRPILTLRLNGKPLSIDKRERDDGIYGPYLISHESYKPRYRILAHEEEMQIPNGLVALRFLNQDAVLDSVRPHGAFAEHSPEMQGYQIAVQNCFRCHNEGKYGGRKSGRSWNALAGIAKSDPAGFAAYIKDPQAQDPAAMMPANPEYDEATLHALTAYFQTFAPATPETGGPKK
jgi:mono/diheme cytochrome c family protein